MKKLDQLLVISFIPPFIMTFFIALFVLIMQFLWKYIDDIIGKGLDIFLILELLFYLSTSLIPTALPIAVLISSVMVMGNLAERYELASIKSAGVPLLRTMMPLILLAVLISAGSFFCSNNIIPIANLKYKSRLYDIRKQRPALNLEEGNYNDDFGETIIRIEEKEPDNRTLHSIQIYDHSTNKGNDNQIIAKDGEMYSSADNRFLVLRLFDGHQYQELQPAKRQDADNYEHLRISFKEWEKIYDLSEFDLKRTNEELFKSHQSMLSTRQLLVAMDSLFEKREVRRKQLQAHAKPYFYIKLHEDTLGKRPIKWNAAPSKLVDSTGTGFIQFIPKERRAQTYTKAITNTRNLKGYTKAVKDDLRRMQIALVKHENELHQKFSLAAACLIFLFIGAPMGAIVRKGGVRMAYSNCHYFLRCLYYD